MFSVVPDIFAIFGIMFSDNLDEPGVLRSEPLHGYELEDNVLQINCSIQQNMFISANVAHFMEIQCCVEHTLPLASPNDIQFYA
jgi:hypothetical protein